MQRTRFWFVQSYPTVNRRLIAIAFGKKPPAERHNKSPSSVVFSSLSVIFYFYICTVGNAEVQPTPTSKTECEVALNIQRTKTQLFLVRFFV